MQETLAFGWFSFSQNVQFAFVLSKNAFHRLFTASLSLTHAKEKASEASAKHAGVRVPPPTQLNLPFCAGVQFSRDYIRVFNDRIKIRENRGQWTVYAFHAETLNWFSLHFKLTKLWPIFRKKIHTLTKTNGRLCFLQEFVFSTPLVLYRPPDPLPRPRIFHLALFFPVRSSNIAKLTSFSLSSSYVIF